MSLRRQASYHALHAAWCWGAIASGMVAAIAAAALLAPQPVQTFRLYMLWANLELLFKLSGAGAAVIALLDPAARALLSNAVGTDGDRA